MAVSPLDGVKPNALAKLQFANLCQILVSYGLYFTLNVICLHYLLRNRKRNYATVGYTILSLIASTALVCAKVKSTEVFFIPGESTASLRRSLDLAKLISYESKICLADSLLIYRLWVIYYEGKRAFIVLPAILLTGVYGSVFAGVIRVATKSFDETAIALGVALHSCSVAFNILATSLIVWKLWKKRKWANTLGLGHAKAYLSISAIFAESGALYAIVGIVYIPLIVLNNPVTYFYGTWMDVAAGIAPLLILLRLAFGVAVSRDTLSALGTESTSDGVQRTKASAIAFSPPPNDTETDGESFSGQKTEA